MAEVILTYKVSINYKMILYVESCANQEYFVDIFIIYTPLQKQYLY